jgi:hypothetical protein
LAQQIPTAGESAGRDRKLAHTGWGLEKMSSASGWAIRPEPAK